ncbi:MAG TPA: hypothetical protein VFI11_13650 [Anaerolineales bacterium]|nr:hypothetical protein [Anaerolineales bacterium]
MSLAYPIWLFFAAFFFYYAYAHWREAEVQVRPFMIRSREGSGVVDPDLAEANQAFVVEFNANLARANHASRGRHRASAVGYMLSGLVALVSMFMLMVRG